MPLYIQAEGDPAAKAKLETEFRMHGESLATTKQADNDKKEEAGVKVAKPADEGEIKKTGLVGPDSEQLLEKAQPEIYKYYLAKRLPKVKEEAKPEAKEEAKPEAKNDTAGADSKDEKKDVKVK